MKIIQINSVSGFGSTGRIVIEIYKELEKKNYESYIAYGRNKNTVSDVNTIKIGSKKDIFNHVLKTRIKDEHGLGSREATKVLIKEIMKINPDIIHLHNVHGYYLNYDILFNFLNSTNIKIIWTLHDCWSFTGHCSHFDNINCNKWITGCNNCPIINSYPKSIFVDNSKKNYNLKKELFSKNNNLIIVTPSVWLKNKVKQSFLKKHEVKVIHNGINTEIFKPNYKNDNLKNFTILCVANVWNKEKGLEFLKDFSLRLENNDVIKIIGLSKSQIKELQPFQNIECIEKLSDAEKLAEYYSNANVFFNPTYNDTFPTTNIEAISSGIPVITFDTGGSGEILDENCGYVIEKGNIEMTLKSIQDVKNKLKTNQNYFINNTRNRALKYFSKEKSTLEYIKLYENVFLEGK